MILAGFDVETELSPRALVALTQLPSETALREAIAAKRVRSHPAGGGGRRKLIVGEFLDDHERLERCPGEGCQLPALSDAGGCGNPAHVRAGRPKSAQTRRKMSESRVALRKGGRPISQAAVELKCAPTNLERVARWRSGPAGEKLIDNNEVERIKRAHCCRNCGALAVGPSEHCRACAGETKRGKPRPPEIELGDRPGSES